FARIRVWIQFPRRVLAECHDSFDEVRLEFERSINSGVHGSVKPTQGQRICNCPAVEIGVSKSISNSHSRQPFRRTGASMLATVGWIWLHGNLCILYPQCT